MGIGKLNGYTWKQEEDREVYREHAGISSLPELATGHRVSWWLVTRLGRAGILLSDRSLSTYV